MKRLLITAILVFNTLGLAAGGTATRAQWHKALELAQKDKNAEATAILEGLRKSSQTEIQKDEITMALGRVKFQAGQLEEALNIYSEIPKSSDFWLESLEERAWTYLRQAKFEKALSLYHTLSAAAFAPQVGPETYLIGSFASLKICDYKSVFDVFKSFKTKYQLLVPELEKISKNASSPATENALAQIRSHIESHTPMKWADLGTDVSHLPRFINRDQELIQDVQLGQKAKALARIQTLVQQDLKDIKLITRKLHIVEVEAMQRMNLTTHKEVANNHVEEKETGDDISFPKEQETWLDEVTHYQVRTDGCRLAKVGTK